MNCLGSGGIQAKSLSKRFSIRHPKGDPRARPGVTYDIVQAVDSVSLDAGVGEVFGLIGPNGAGKSTLLNILATLLIPDEGEAYVNGFDIARQVSQVRRSISGTMSIGGITMPNSYGTVRQLKTLATLYAMPEHQSELRIGMLLDELGIKSFMERRSARLSSGMSARVTLAKLLLPDRPVLLLDEPFTHIDFKGVRDAAYLLRDITRREGRTVLLVTHDLRIAEAACHRVGLISHGKLVKMGGMADLRTVADDGMYLEVEFGPGVSRDECGLLSELGEVSWDSGTETRAKLTLDRKWSRISDVAGKLEDMHLPIVSFTIREASLEEMMLRSTSN